MTMEDPVSAEVVRLHRFFDAWYNGKKGLRIGEFGDAMDPLFTIVGPDGHVIDRETIIAAVENSFGKGGVRIAVESFAVIEGDGYVVCRYDEVQTTPSGSTTRLSTAVMEPDNEAPGGYRWLTVHETWAPS